ncbi:MAG: AMP-binding protein [Succinivibrio sp.]
MELNRTPWFESYPSDVPNSIDPGLYDNINGLFDAACGKFKDRKAFICLNRSITFSEVHRKTQALASYLQQILKARKGERLALILPNVMQYPISVFAGLKCGMEIVNINPLYTSHEILGVLRDCGAKIVICLETTVADVLKIHDQTYLEHIITCTVGDCLGTVKGSLINFYLRHVSRMVKPYNRQTVQMFNDCLRVGEGRKFREVSCSLDDIAFLQYTGGTTGKPKGAMLSHGNILANVVQADAMYGPRLIEGSEKILTALPLYHIFAMTVNLMFAFYKGCSNLLIIDPRKFENLIARLKENPDVSIIIGVNTLFNAFVNNDVFRKVKFTNLRLVVGGGTAVQPGVAARFLKSSGGIPILEGYGLTECSPLCCVVPYTQSEYNGTIGIPTPSTLARIVDIDTGDEIWDTQKPGELEFKGPQVMKGYFENEKETENVFHDGWLRTGDIAKWCEGGYLKIIDRIKDMILVSGFNVFPNEIENVVSRNDKVLECAVVGVPSKTTGESIKLYIVRKDHSLTRDEVLDHCRNYLTGYKLPKHIEFVESLPKSPVGKVMRRFLKQNRLS